MRTVDRQLKHLLYRLYVSPFIRFDEGQIAGSRNRLELAVENTGFLRSSIMTAARIGEEPLSSRFYDYGDVAVEILLPVGFSISGSRTVNIGWLGGDIMNAMRAIGLGRKHSQIRAEKRAPSKIVWPTNASKGHLTSSPAKPGASLLKNITDRP